MVLGRTQGLSHASQVGAPALTSLPRQLTVMATSWSLVRRLCRCLHVAEEESKPQRERAGIPQSYRAHPRKNQVVPHRISQLLFCWDKIPEAHKEENNYFGSGVRGFCPWLPGSEVAAPWEGEWRGQLSPNGVRSRAMTRKPVKRRGAGQGRAPRTPATSSSERVLAPGSHPKHMRLLGTV